MARNRVQFQKGVSLNEFISHTVLKINVLMRFTLGDGLRGFAALTVVTINNASLPTVNCSSAIAAIIKHH